MIADRIADVISTPQNLGNGFEHFGEWRDGQLQAISTLVASSKKFKIAELPTGAGKSIIAAAMIRLSRNKGIITVETKQLQEQYLNDFSHAVEIKGRANYPCPLWIHLGMAYGTAEDCIHQSSEECARCFHEFTGSTNEWMDKRFGRTCMDDSNRTCYHCPYQCPYTKAKAVALASETVITNRSYFLSEANWVGGFSASDSDSWLILDEGDTLESSLRSFIELSITQKQLDKLQLEPPVYKTKAEAWREWARRTTEVLTAKLDIAQKEFKNLPSLDKARELKLLSGMSKNVDFFLSEVNDYWVADLGQSRWSFKPVLVSPYSDWYLFRHAKNVLIMSATICGLDRFCHELGIPRNDVEFISLPSTFDVKNRMVYYMPTAALSKATEEAEFPKIVNAIDEILDLYPNDKGLIHTVSYDRARRIAALSRHQNRIVSHSAEDRVAALTEFKQSTKPLVFVSPSMERGTDLSDDLCRVVIWAKLPWAYLGDPQVSKRVHAFSDGNKWYKWNTARTIVQGTGRAVRSRDDHAVNFILDAEFGRLYHDRGLFPQWWRESLREIKSPQEVHDEPLE